MPNQIRTFIAGTGSHIPEIEVINKDFMNHVFYGADKEVLSETNEHTIQKFRDITEIDARKFVPDDLVTSDIGFFAAKAALKSACFNAEFLNGIIVAHNFGDVTSNNRRSDTVPSLASRIKKKLEIENPNCIAEDILFGCPGWLQGVIHADRFIRSGDMKTIMVIGAETLSRISDPHDRDSMIYADGAGAVILRAHTLDDTIGILSHAVRSDTLQYSNLLAMKPSYNPDYPGNDLFLKMNGTKLYAYALNFVPGVVKDALDKAGLHLTDVSKVLIHQANAKMDYAILERIAKLYGLKTSDLPANIMPMTIHKLGNSSVATIPTLLDLLFKKQLPDHEINSGEIIVFASVGAGMNINAVVYRMP